MKLDRFFQEGEEAVPPSEEREPLTVLEEEEGQPPLQMPETIQPHVEPFPGTMEQPAPPTELALETTLRPTLVVDFSGAVKRSIEQALRQMTHYYESEITTSPQKCSR